MSTVTVIGDGGWGTALAILLYNKGLKPVLWSYSEDYARYLDRERENAKFLKGVKIPPGLRITSDTGEAKACEFAVFAVPCTYVRSVAGVFKGAPFKCVISATKGIENDTLKRPSEMLADYFEGAHIGALSGPNISFEVAKGFPAAAVFASRDNWKKEVQGLLNSEQFRVYASEDIVGVEIGGALKNIIAIAAGISDGMGFGTNTKAGLMTRGLAEMTRLGVKMGAKKETFAGLSGMGDLATTCMSEHSRNHWFGKEIGKGRSPGEALKDTEMVVEGVNTCRSAYELSKKHSVDMPITHRLYEILYEKKDPRVAVRELMTRDLKDEDYG